jgi:ribosomal protein L37AE/L43A
MKIATKEDLEAIRRAEFRCIRCGSMRVKHRVEGTKVCMRCKFTSNQAGTILNDSEFVWPGNPESGESAESNYR